MTFLKKGMGILSRTVTLRTNGAYKVNETVTGNPPFHLLPPVKCLWGIPPPSSILGYNVSVRHYKFTVLRYNFSIS